ncbi:MAG: hypothetical protein ACREID_04435 [Planctomycetota bacterium]
MADHDRLKRKPLAEILVDEGVVQKQAVIAALHEQQANRRLLSDILLDAAQVTEFHLARVLVDQLQAPFIDLTGYTFHKDLIQVFPARLLREYAILPLDRFGSVVTFACQEPPPAETVEKLKRYAPGGMYFYVALAAEIRRCLEDYVSLEEAPAASAAKHVVPADVKNLPDLKIEEDTAWKELFDSANDAILSDLGRDES